MKTSAEGPGSPVPATDSVTDPGGRLGWRLQALVALRESLLHSETTGAERPETLRSTGPEAGPARIPESQPELGFLGGPSTVLADQAPVPESASPVEQTLADLSTASTGASPWDLIAQQVLAVAPQQPLLGSWLRFPEQDQIRHVEIPPVRRPVIYLSQDTEVVPVAPVPEPPVRPDLQNLDWSASSARAPQEDRSGRSTEDETEVVEPEAPPRRGLPKGFWIALAVTFVVAAGVIVWRPWSSSAPRTTLAVSKPAPPITAPPAADWDSVDIAPAPNETEGRTLLLQRSVPAQPYEMRMMIDLRRNAQQWVMHAKDDRNFVAYGYEVLSRRPLQFLLYRYQTVNGNEGPHAQIPFDLGPNPAPRFQVSTLVEPNRIQLLVNGRVLDTFAVAGRGRAGLMSTPGNPADWSDLTVSPVGSKR